MQSNKTSFTINYIAKGHETITTERGIRNLAAYIQARRYIKRYPYTYTTRILPTYTIKIIFTFIPIIIYSI